MQVHHFDNFDLDAKACITWRNGVHLCFKANGPYYMALYRLDNFYVEIQYHTSYDGIDSIHTFTCEDQIQSYLDQLDINHLLD